MNRHLLSFFVVRSRVVQDTSGDDMPHPLGLRPDNFESDKKPTYLLVIGWAIMQEKNLFQTNFFIYSNYWLKTRINIMQNIEINIYEPGTAFNPTKFNSKWYSKITSVTNYSQNLLAFMAPASESSPIIVGTCSKKCCLRKSLGDSGRKINDVGCENIAVPSCTGPHTIPRSPSWK